eukprot:TRINITY_DN49059_c0_g1_i1.p1 TRINITY_DN49059_c0_g1~~TRINITY_DN49059_c0_g1_i1.p1  ORF type:complete len:227 (-),score=32.54 TRINITY_DN49059_c0_g1_i1:63-743(-)
MAACSDPLVQLFQPTEWGVTDVEMLGRREQLGRLSEFQCLTIKCLSLTVLTCAVVFAFSPANPPSSSWCLYGAMATLGFAMVLEFVRGYLHFLFPYSSHLICSGMADIVDIRDKDAPLALVATVTHQFGAANLLLGAMYAAVFLFPDPAHHSLVFALSITFVVRVIQANQMQCGAINFFRPALPRWLSQGDTETRKKAPPGKTAQDVQVFVQLAGLCMAVAACCGY